MNNFIKKKITYFFKRNGQDILEFRFDKLIIRVKILHKE